MSNHGIAISLMVPASSANALALDIDGALPASELHVTLAYLGTVSDVDINLGRLVEIVSSFAKTVNPIRLNINGAGFFENEETAVWLAVDSSELPELRQSLVQYLDSNNIHINQDHGFMPHITLAYMENGKTYPEFELNKLNFLVREITIMYAGERISCPMGKESRPRMDIAKFLKSIFTKNRSLSIDLAWEQVWILIGERSSESIDEAVWPIDIYLDNDETFVVAARKGRLVRAPIVVNNDKVLLGDWRDVEVQFIPQIRSKVIKREEGKRPLIVQVVSTSTLNRDGEIDSRVLYDSFIRNCKDSGVWPTVDFFHHNAIRLGKVVPGGAIREENCYINVWEFNDDEIGRAAQEGYLANPDYWGASIEFVPLKRSLVDVGDGVRVPVYEEGIHTYTTIVPENRAAAWFTGKKVRTMNENNFLELVKLLGDEDLAKQAASLVDGTNEEIRSKGMITRANQEGQEEVAGNQSGGQEEQPKAESVPTETVIELDDDVTEHLVSAVLQSSSFVEIEKRVGEVTRAINDLKTLIANVDTSIRSVQDRLGAVEVSEEDRVRQELGNLPRGTVRVRVNRATSEGEQPTTVTNAAVAAHNVVDGWNFRSN